MHLNLLLQTKLTSLTKGVNQLQMGPFQDGPFQGSRGFHAIPAPELGQRDGLLLGGSAQEPAFGLMPQANFERFGDKVGLIDASGLQLADLPQFDPSALAGAEMLPIRTL